MATVTSIKESLDKQQPELKTINIKGKPYVEVNERIKYFRANYQGWSIETEILSVDNGICIMKAIVRDDQGNIQATGHAFEKEDSSFINQTSYIENCETSAVGRALGILGIGIDTSIASKEEVENAQLNQCKVKVSNKPLFVCNDCGENITESVYKFSNSKFGKPLCMKCQKNNK